MEEGLPLWLSLVLEEVEVAVLVFQVVAWLNVFLLFLVYLGMLQESSGLWRLEMPKSVIEIVTASRRGSGLAKGYRY